MDLQSSRSFTKSDLESMLLDEATEPRALPFSLLEEITNEFYYKKVIGRGGFAVVYKGVLKNGVVAIKMLTNTYMYEKEFIREIECLMKVKHRNIVRFLGYCSDTQGNMQTYNGKFVMADVQQRLLCFEYVGNGSLDDYIKDESGGHKWSTRYRIIKEICAGLHFLHSLNIMHLDLKPANILMDDNLTPKITDFGLSRIFEECQTRVVATKMFGTMGYLAPEFTSNVITPKFDLYSLGVIIMEILTGNKDRQPIEIILGSWAKRFCLWKQNPYFEQVRVCAEIGIECTNFDPTKRPVSMKHVMDRLAETELPPLKHHFYQELSEYISLHLTNMTDEHVVFRLMQRSSNSLHWYYSNEYLDNAMYGVVHPGATCTLIMATEVQSLAQGTGIDLVLQSSISGDKNITICKGKYACNKFFEEAKELGHAVYEEALKVVHTVSQGETTSEPAVRPKITKPIFLEYPELLTSMDAHPTEPWIVIGHGKGNVSLWNHVTKTLLDSFIISETTVGDIKFHATKNWIVARVSDGSIHVYNCVYKAQTQKITSFNALNSYIGYSVNTHPTKPYVLSASLKLWDMDKGWECTHTFGTHRMRQMAFIQEQPELTSYSTRYVLDNRLDRLADFSFLMSASQKPSEKAKGWEYRHTLGTHGMRQLRFNQEDPDIFACATYGRKVEVWSIDSPESYYTLDGHLDRVVCLNFFKHDDGQCLITGSDDCTAKIWDLQTKACIHTMEGFMSPVIYVISIPGRPYLVTCSGKATVQVWSSTDFGLNTTVNFSGGGLVKGLACLMGSRRIAIGQGKGLSIMEIDDEEDAVASKGNNPNVQLVNQVIHN